MKKRKYNKSSKYWDKFNNQDRPIEEILNSMGADDSLPATAGDSFYVGTSHASQGRAAAYSGNTASRRNSIHYSEKKYQYNNIAQGMLPYNYGKGNGVDVREAIELCQKAYANIAIFRNAIDIMAEFSNSPIYLEGENDKSKKFVENWMKKIGIWKLKDQYFREYYRSGNVFLYRIDGKFSTDDLLKLNYVYASESLMAGEMPVKYILLNPYDIVADRSTSFREGSYKKILSEYELEKLRDPKTDEDRKVLESLDKDTREKIETGSYTAEGLDVKLNPKKLVYSFYKKQDYEPFAIPFGFPVLEDINWKLELKKIDQAICRTVENVILLITMGAEPEKGGINPQNLKAMQELFKNESVGRALIADYTTKAQFVIPDLNKVLGSEKYKIVNEDIKEGLQNVIVGSEKFSNTQIKAEIFLERLKESRNAFLNDFLQPQIKEVCENMGLKNYPVAKFEEIDIKDEVQFHRVITRLLEIGILTPEQGIKSMQTGIYPDPKDLPKVQDEYISQREKGFYNPLVGGIPMIEGVQSQKDRALKKQEMKKSENEQSQPQNTENVNKTPKSAGRPGGTTNIPVNASKGYDKKLIQKTIYDIEELQLYAEASFIKNKKIENISEPQKELIVKLCESVVCAKDRQQWNRTLLSCIKNVNNIEKLTTIDGIVEIGSEHELSEYPAAILYHSKK